MLKSPVAHAGPAAALMHGPRQLLPDALATFRATTNIADKTAPGRHSKRQQRSARATQAVSTLNFLPVGNFYPAGFRHTLQPDPTVRPLRASLPTRSQARDCHACDEATSAL